MISRSASDKNKTKASLRSSARDSLVDPEEVLKSLKEEKNKVGLRELSSEAKKKGGRKRKQDLSLSDVDQSPAKSSLFHESKGKIHGISTNQKSSNKDSFSIVKTPVAKATEKANMSKSGAKGIDKDICEIVLDDNDIKQEVLTRADDSDKFVCPYEDCQSESKNAQSIKIHLALVHYKKTIQAEFPNWKKQKCDECDRSIGRLNYLLFFSYH